MIKTTDEMIDYLELKYSEKTHPPYVFRDVSNKFLQDKRIDDLLRNYKTIDGSSTFQVAVFFPDKTTFSIFSSVTSVWNMSMVHATFLRIVK